MVKLWENQGLYFAIQHTIVVCNYLYVRYICRAQPSKERSKTLVCSSLKVVTFKLRLFIKCILPNKEINNQRQATQREFEPVGPIMLKNPFDTRWG